MNDEHLNVLLHETLTFLGRRAAVAASAKGNRREAAGARESEQDRDSKLQESISGRCETIGKNRKRKLPEIT